MKKTKRKAFNFLRSYFDVLNELKTESDKLGFLMSIINKQFLDEDPKDLNFLVKLCYESQRHSVETSVKGWKRASCTDMEGHPPTNPTTHLGSNPPTNPKEEEEKEEEKEKVKDIKARQLAFKNSLWNKFKNDYNAKTIEAFYLYSWTEHGDEDKKMRFEKQKSFSVSLRLKNWAKNNFDKTEPTKQFTNNAHLFMS